MPNNRTNSLVGRLVRSPGLRVTALAVLVVLPLVVMACYLLTPDWPDAFPVGDEASLELMVWRTLHGVQLEGHGSHNTFRNLGPMQFYLPAPLYWATGCRLRGICLTAVLINLASLVGILVVTQGSMGRAAMVWSALLLMLYLGFMDRVQLVLAWPASVTVLPFVFAVVLFTAVAAGRLWWLPAALGVSSYVVQTYVAYVPALLGVACFSLAVCFAPRLRAWSGIGGRRTGSVGKTATVCLAVLISLWALPVVRELTAPASDLGAMIRVFTQHGAGHSWGETLAVMTRVTAYFPIHCFGGPADPIWPGEVHAIHVVAAAVQLILLAMICWAARRSKRDYETALGLMCIVLLVTTTFSVRWITGDIAAHMVHWMTVTSLLIMIALGGVCMPWLHARLRLEDRPFHRWAVGVFTAAVFAWACVANVQKMVADIPLLQDDTDATEDVEPLLTASRKILQTEGARNYLLRIVDHDRWPTAASLILKLTKEGSPPALDPEWLLMFGSQHAAPPRLDGMLLLCDRESVDRLHDREHVELIARTQRAALFWCSAEGIVSFDLTDGTTP